MVYISDCDPSPREATSSSSSSSLRLRLRSLLLLLLYALPPPTPPPFCFTVKHRAAPRCIEEARYSRNVQHTGVASDKCDPPRPPPARFSLSSSETLLRRLLPLPRRSSTKG